MIATTVAHDYTTAELRIRLERKAERLDEDKRFGDGALMRAASQEIARIEAENADLRDCHRRLVRAIQGGAASGTMCDTLLRDLEDHRWIVPEGGVDG